MKTGVFGLFSVGQGGISAGQIGRLQAIKRLHSRY